MGPPHRSATSFAPKNTSLHHELVTSGGKHAVNRLPTGVAPIAAMSLKQRAMAFLPISSGGVSVVNDRVGDMDVVATGSASQNFAVVYNRQLEDCTTLNFNSVKNQLPVVMIDNEGNRWDIFGTALSGPRAGTQLQKTNSYIAYWLAWTAFFPAADIYQ